MPRRASPEDEKRAAAVIRIIEQLDDVIHAGGRTLFGKPVKDVRSFFAALDRDNSGALEIDRCEIERGLQRLGVAAPSRGRDVERGWRREVERGGLFEQGSQKRDASPQWSSAVCDFLRLLDSDRNGLVELSELARGLTELPRELRAEIAQQRLFDALQDQMHARHIEDMRYFLNALDRSRTGTAERQEIRREFLRFDGSIRREHVDGFLDTLPNSTEGRIDLDELVGALYAEPRLLLRLAARDSAPSTPSSGARPKTSRGRQDIIRQERDREFALGSTLSDGDQTSVEKLRDTARGLLRSPSRGARVSTRSSEDVGWGSRAALINIVRHLSQVIRQGKRTLFGQRINSVSTFFAALDLDGNGALEKDEIALGFQRLDVAVRTDDVLDFLKLVDTDNNGCIGPAELARGLGNPEELLLERPDLRSPSSSSRQRLGAALAPQKLETQEDESAWWRHADKIDRLAKIHELLREALYRDGSSKSGVLMKRIGWGHDQLSAQELERKCREHLPVQREGEKVTSEDFKELHRLLDREGQQTISPSRLEDFLVLEPRQALIWLCQGAVEPPPAARPLSSRGRQRQPDEAEAEVRGATLVQRKEAELRRKEAASSVPARGSAAAGVLASLPSDFSAVESLIQKYRALPESKTLSSLVQYLENLAAVLVQVEQQEKGRADASLVSLHKALLQQKQLHEEPAQRLARMSQMGRPSSSAVRSQARPRSVGGSYTVAVARANAQRAPGAIRRGRATVSPPGPETHPFALEGRSTGQERPRRPQSATRQLPRRSEGGLIDVRDLESLLQRDYGESPTRLLHQQGAWPDRPSSPDDRTRR